MGKKLNNDKHDFVSPAKRELHNDLEYFARGQELHKQYKDFKGNYSRRNISRPLFEKISNFIKDAYYKRFNYHPERTQDQILQAWSSVRKELDKIDQFGVSTKPTKTVKLVKPTIFEDKTASTPFPLRPAKEIELINLAIKKLKDKERLQKFADSLKGKSLEELKRMLRG